MQKNTSGEMTKKEKELYNEIIQTEYYIALKRKLGHDPTPNEKIILWKRAGVLAAANFSFIF